MPFAVMQHEDDPKQEILDGLGDLSGFELFNNQVLCAVYIKPKMTKGGVLLPDSARDEDRLQGKVGLIVKLGSQAFVDTETSQWFTDYDMKMHDWAVFKPSNGWSITINGILCRILDDVDIRAKINHPDMAW